MNYLCTLSNIITDYGYIIEGFAVLVLLYKYGCIFAESPFPMPYMDLFMLLLAISLVRIYVCTY